MSDEDFRVEIVGHAALRVKHGRRTFLTDPWLVDPIGCGSGFHFPPVVHDPARLAAETDAIYISHIHPDHFHPPSLALFSRDVPIYIGSYRRKDFRDQVAALGFPVVEVPFQTPIAVGNTGFEITLVEHDYEESAAYDSAVVIRTPQFTIFENNDCYLHASKYEWVRKHFEIDYAFLGYSPASFFPIAFDMEDAEKKQLLEAAAERRYGDFLESAQILQPKLAIPFASEARFLLASSLWKNVSFNSAGEAVRRLDRVGLRGAQMRPGDRIDGHGRVVQVSRHYQDVKDETDAIQAYAGQVQPWVIGLQRSLPASRPDLVDRFRAYVLQLREKTARQIPGVEKYVIAYQLLGDHPVEFYFDFSQPEARIFQWGRPPRYDMLYRYLAPGLQLVLDGEIDWDVLHFAEEVSVHQVTYAREFYQMLRSEMLDLE